ncbi:thioredoxin family protein [Ignavibacteria bacterium]
MQFAPDSINNNGNMKYILFAIVFSLITLSAVFCAAGTKDHAEVSLSPASISGKAGDTVRIKLTLALEKGWHIYDLEQGKRNEAAGGIGPNPLEISMKGKTIRLGRVKAPKSHIEFDSTFGVQTGLYHGTVVFDVPVIIKRDAKRGKYVDSINVFPQVCTDEGICTYPEFALPVTVEVTAESASLAVEEPSVAVNQNVEATAQPSEQSKPATSSGAATVTESQSEIEQAKNRGVWSFLWFAITAGAGALLTPCVFPMVPITVSFFTKRSEKASAKGLRDSLVYALGIIATFTALGFILSLLLGSTGISDFATDPWVNIVIASIFIVFAFNLFGAFEIQIPPALLNKLNAKSSQGGVGGVLLMGLTFSLTSFTCTVPFVGSALIAASKGEWFYPIIGMLGFSGTFALPFFLLALFPSLLNKLPRAGGWMNNMKVVMGFLEIAAALKFISNVDLAWGLGILPPNVFLAIWGGCGALITIYVLGLFRLKLDSPVTTIGTPRVVFAIVFSAITIYLFSGMNGTPLGTLTAFLPPPDYEQHVGGAATEPASASGIRPEHGNGEEVWLSDYKVALAQAKREGKPLFVDFTGFTCTNCRWMETNMFPKPAVRSLMDKMVKVRLYTDRRTEPYTSNKSMMQTRFQTIELPLYAVISPDDHVLDTQTFTRSETEFVEFLNKAFGSGISASLQ